MGNRPTPRRIKISNNFISFQEAHREDVEVKMNLNKRFFPLLFLMIQLIWRETLTWAEEMVISFPFMYIYIKSVGSYWELFHWVLLKGTEHWIERENNAEQALKYS